MDFPKKQQQCLIPRYLLQYLQDLQISHNDPTAPWGGGGGGGSYTAGDGIEISDEDVISIDDTVALKSDIPSLTGYATETWVTNQGYLVQSDLSNYVTTSELTTELSNYVTSTDLATELLDYAELSDLATVATTGSYNDLLNKPTIPTDTSDLTNGAGYITSSALSNYVTTNTAQEITGIKTFTGQLPIKFKQASSSNILGFTAYDNNNNQLGNLQIADRNFGGTPDIYTTLGNYSLNSTKSKVGFRLSPNGNLNSFNFVMPYGTYSDFYNSGYRVNADTTIPCAFTDGTHTINANAAGVVDLSYLNIGGSSYSAGTGIDITNNTIAIDSTVVALKSDIPTISGNYSGSYWTKITINGTTKSIPSSPSNMVTTNTTQTISGSKTFNNTVTFSGYNNTAGNVVFTGWNPIKMKAPSGSTTGFTLFNSNNYEKGYLQYNSTQDALYLGRWGNASSSPQYAQNIGFLSELGSNGYRVLMPNKTSTSSATETANTYYIPTEITNGTTVVKASSDGIIDISSLISGGGGGGTTVSGTNNGTNWTSITIGSDTYGIPSGGGSGSGPTVTKYDTSSYMSYSWQDSNTFYAILNGNPNSGEFRIQDTNPGDVLIFDVTLINYVNDSMRSRRHLIEVTVPIKSTNDYYDEENTYLSSSYKIFRANESSADQNTMVLEIENLDIASPYRVEIGALMVPSRDSSVDNNATITINSITHIAY